MSDAARQIHAPLGVVRGIVSRRLLTLSMGILATGMLASGCSQHAVETGWSDPSKVQVQFYAPPGATVRRISASAAGTSAR